MKYHYFYDCAYNNSNKLVEIKKTTCKYCLARLWKYKIDMWNIKHDISDKQREQMENIFKSNSRKKILIELKKEAYLRWEY